MGTFLGIWVPFLYFGSPFFYFKLKNAKNSCPYHCRPFNILKVLPVSCMSGDVTIRRWSNGKDGAIDVTVTSPLSPSNVAGAAAQAGASLAKACQRKERDTAEACRREGFVFLPFAMETLGGLHSGAVNQVKQLAAALARCKGLRRER